MSEDDTAEHQLQRSKKPSIWEKTAASTSRKIS
jgi:hypothetical protein